MAVKEKLLQIADEAQYFDLSPADLERVWVTCNNYIDRSRFSCTEIEWFALVEMHFYLSVLTCRDVVAKLMLQRLVEKFGDESRRVFKLRTVLVLATLDAEAMEKHLQAENTAVELEAAKIGMVPFKNDTQKYLNKLTAYLDTNPLDSESWSELTEVYYKLGEFSKAVNCLEQTIIVEPYSYYAFTRIGELKRLEAVKSPMSSKLILESQKHFARAVELNDSYIRAWCGLLVVSFLSEAPQSLKLINTSKRKINELMTQKIGSAEDLEAASEVMKAVNSGTFN